MPDKEKELKIFTKIYKDLLDLLTKINETIKTMNFESEIPNSDGELTSDIILKDVKQMQQAFEDLIKYSSLRYFPSIVEIFEFDDSEINLKFKIQDWCYDCSEYIHKKAPNSRKVNSISTSYDRDIMTTNSTRNTDRKGGDKRRNKKSCFSVICPCFSSPEKKATPRKK